MDETKSIQEQHTAGAQAIGFDYQFYYFMLLALELRHGQKVGFEVKDDVHIDKADGTTILFQTKHSVLTSSNGAIQNLTTLDSDLWKTLSNWTNFIKKGKENYLNKHSFVLATNKNENSNQFINALHQFKIDEDIDNILAKLNDIKTKTKDETLQKYIENLISLDKTKLSSFLSKISIETGVDEIIKRIKNKLLELYRENHIVETIYDSLYSNLQLSKYLEIKSGQKFEITFDDFNKKFGKCFKVSTGVQKLPTRNFPILLPENPEEQIFIKQLLDVGEIQAGSQDVIKYTTLMLKFLRHYTYWSDEENFILFSEAEDFKKDSISRWDNEFKGKYRQIERKISSGTTIESLESEIKDLSIGLVEYIRRLDLSIGDYLPLGVDFTNGHYYLLSNKLEIGWHFDWQNKYKE
ncbi:hypothetical protein H0S70_01015 [Chryseobacterium manosquense]|jgi:hypothetical protein|uniref:CD-NTase associated protein 4-like DNA endonuclease domain-containing protein n=2 Tax=Chryseobacterium group TaxID=2782232 RepID=A0A246B8A5_9FLAO|nr:MULTISPECIES: hypothetical protein [Flavobacteriales]MBP7318149.1 hypothetical protein [Flavobacterium sp.]OWK97609.1 hypothetical protein AP75_10305 [Kaistella haifensis DSM 19056]QNS41605.1 hypothetical protein H0S70_01015 [Chryseobacterium manosquense]